MADQLQYFITRECICCDNCRQHCPEGAVYAADDKYGINDKQCKGCGICAQVCPVGAIHEDPDPYRSLNREFDSFFGGGAWPLPGNNPENR